MTRTEYTAPAAERGGAVEKTDVLIVGYGPVGQVLALLLARKGRRVTVVERWLKAYTMPRAVAFDSEGARILASTGIAEDIARIGEPSGEYTWENAAGVPLLHIDVEERGLCWWPESTSMYQPGLEDALMARGAALPGLTVHRGHRAVELTDRGGEVEVVAVAEDGSELVVTADWVVGCDGANSFVRGHIGTDAKDFGFSHDWLICDVVPHDTRTYSPNNLQICDPERPRTEVSAGPGHRRWEFMRTGDETVAALNTPERAWELLGLFDVRPDNATLERHHVYTFEARSANVWRSGRLLIAGDAAHVMPPFAGQGMSSGFRDVANLAWRLDLVLDGKAGASVLDSYPEERRAHVQHAIGMSVNLGKIICQSDPAAAADRDLVMAASAKRAAETGTVPQRSPLMPLTGGLLHKNAAGRLSRPAGTLMPQGRVARGTEEGLFDELVGSGFVLLATEPPAKLLDPEDLDFLTGLGARLVHVLPAGATAAPGEDEVVDVDDFYLPHLAKTGSVAVLVRPDFYVYGAAGDATALADVVGSLRRQLDTPAPATA
ncbi:bifunctional 3-(3-hydroxy-phenyl)propionate/3-hydroxycinnamic acid hydroxylase [Kitasatospora sp. NPDC059327]|uniref:bifunctional 3-(3-hydroxy-phenyl)propionate/3-hydroxycinnamic acid hydroxylase MhpA n=1 Tax=Kitasatospora sp. NPDC059327 TaxID=3346803 RepID=UPI00368F8B9E